MLDASVQLLKVAVLFMLVVQNFELLARFKAIKAKLARWGS